MRQPDQSLIWICVCHDHLFLSCHGRVRVGGVPQGGFFCSFPMSSTHCQTLDVPFHSDDRVAWVLSSCCCQFCISCETHCCVVVVKLCKLVLATIPVIVGCGLPFSSGSANAALSCHSWRTLAWELASVCACKHCVNWPT